MTTQANYKDEWLDKAFQLAFFLHGDRETAKAIAAGAMNKLETASNAQFKRHYYTPTGRADAGTRPARSRVSLSDLQLLQRLVFVESESFEREKEKNAGADKTSLTKFFVKHLVRISLKRNSFYVTLAVSRILHNYGTADAMEIYNLVVQDPERVHDDYYYRSRKGVLMKELKARFGDLLEIVRVNRGEERFQAHAPDEALSATAKDSLRFFTPWNSHCALPEKFDPFADVIKPFHFDKRAPDEEHRVEVNRIHAALHPCCFGRLAAALRLAPPENKMEIPQFMNTENQAGFDDQDWRNPPRLEADELRQIKDILKSQAESRRALAAGFLRVRADGNDCARLDLGESGSVKFDLDGGAELIEVYGAGGGRRQEETLLATHLLNYEELEKGNQTQTVSLEGGQKISFVFAPSLDQYGEVAGLSCTVNYAETAPLRRLALRLRRTKFATAGYFSQNSRLLKPALSFGLLLLMAVTVGWFVLQRTGEDQPQIAGPTAPTPAGQNNPIDNPEVFAEEAARPAEENLVEENAPEDFKRRAAPPPRRPGKVEVADNEKPRPVRKTEVSPRKGTVAEPRRTPQEALQAGDRQPRREKSDTDQNGVLRLPLREDRRGGAPERETNKVRGNSNNQRAANNLGKSLREIKLIYLEISGDRVLGEKIAGQVSAEIQKAGVFAVTGDKEQAEAALKIYVRHEADGDAPADATVAAVVRLVNAEGFVVYPNLARVSGWKYVGTIERLPARIARDFIKAAAKAKGAK